MCFLQVKSEEYSCNKKTLVKNITDFTCNLPDSTNYDTCKTIDENLRKTIINAMVTMCLLGKL